MRSILVTGADGFIGRNLRTALARRNELAVLACDLPQARELESMVARADLVIHLAGINRPRDPSEFLTGNVEVTRRVVAAAERGLKPGIVFASSIHAATDHPYGASKRAAEEIILDYGRRTGAPTYVYRLEHVFGKWCRPNYNSVVATFCHNLAHGLDLLIDDPAHELQLLYIDTVIAEFLRVIDGAVSPSTEQRLFVRPTFPITVGELARRLRAIAAIRETLVVPDLADPLTRYLHGTFISYLPLDMLSHPLTQRTDHRGSLAEIVKSHQFGQLFVSRSFRGVTRGNHFHDTKVEKFCVVQGQADIKFRAIDGTEVTTYHVSGDRPEVVDIPPGYTHSISNASDDELVVLFWANEIFDPERPDTHSLAVETAKK